MELSKETLRVAILVVVEERRRVLANAVKNLVDATVHDDAKQEGKYDTRAIESGYIASAQAERLREAEELVEYVRTCRFVDYLDGKPIGVGALVSVEIDGEPNWYFLLAGVSLEVTVDGHKVRVVTPQSAVGKALVGLVEAETFELDTPKGSRDGEIISVR